MHYTVTVTDDQPVDCARVSVQSILGHDAHGHPQTTAAGCAGRLRSPRRWTQRTRRANISAVYVATYTDAPGGGETPQQGSDEVVLRPGQ